MVRRHPAGHEIKRICFVRKRLGGVQTRRHGKPAFPRGTAGCVQHRLRNVRERHVVSKRGEEQSGMAGAGGDIEHPRSGREREMFESGADILHILQDVAFAVAFALPGELFLGSALHVVELHGMDVAHRRLNCDACLLKARRLSLPAPFGAEAVCAPEIGSEPHTHLG